MKKILQKKIDWIVYRLAYKSINRLCRDNPGMCYLFELHLRKWNDAQNISPELKAATETFFNSLHDDNSRSN